MGAVDSTAAKYETESTKFRQNIEFALFSRRAPDEMFVSWRPMVLVENKSESQGPKAV